MGYLTNVVVLMNFAVHTLAALDGSRFLWYDEPAIEWERGALPIGNGRMGGTVFGSLNDIFTINEDTIWSGPLQDRTPANALAALPKARELFLQGDLTGGGDFVLSDMNSAQSSQRQYSYFGNLDLNFGHSGLRVDEYVRWLDTKQGNTGVSYAVEGVNFTYVQEASAMP
jgi:hypothetical protein